MNKKIKTHNINETQLTKYWLGMPLLLMEITLENLKLSAATYTGLCRLLALMAMLYDPICVHIHTADDNTGINNNNNKDVNNNKKIIIIIIIVIMIFSIYIAPRYKNGLNNDNNKTNILLTLL